MSKYVKGLIQKELEKKFDGLSEFVVVGTMGIDGHANNELRGALLEKGVHMSTVKNSMMRLACKNIGLTAAAALFMAGPCTVVHGGDSIVDVAKMMQDWKKKIKAIDVKGAFVDGEVLDAEGAKALSKMPTRAELQGTVAMLAMSPGRQVAGAVAGPGGIIAGCIKGLVEKLEEAA